MLQIERKTQHSAAKKKKEREIDGNTIIVGDFNTPLSSIDRSLRQKINKETSALNKIPDQMDLTDTCRTFHPKATEYTFFSSTRGMFSRTDHVLGHKQVSKFKKIEIISSIFSDHSTKIGRASCRERV